MDDPIPTLAARLGGGEHLLMAWCGIPDASVPEQLVRAGFDVAVLDMQHGSFDTDSAAAAITAVATAGKPALVRIPVGEFATASRLLDAGAAGIIAPMINSAADATLFASFCKFPPLGSRSWGPTRAMTLSGLGPGEYLQRANGIHLALAMIETTEAIAALDDILAVDGIDGVLVGPSDLSITLSDGAGIDPHGSAVAEALRRVIDRCGHHRKVAAVFCIDGDRAKQLSAMGFQLCSVGTDQVLLGMAATAQLGIARS